MKGAVSIKILLEVLILGWLRKSCCDRVLDVNKRS